MRKFEKIFFLLFFLLKCGGDGEILPPQNNIKTFYIDLNEVGEKINPLNGIEKTPVSIKEGEPDLRDKYVNNGVFYVRLPEGSGCEYTMEGIFPDEEKDEEKPENYDFSKIDKIIEPLILTGRTPIFQAIYDYGGEKKCIVEEGIQKGVPTSNPLKWAKVVAGILKHFNNGAMQWQPKLWNIKYVEFLNDPFLLGGYSIDQAYQVFSNYYVFAKEIKSNFPKIFIGGIAHTINGYGEAQNPLNPMEKFIGYIKDMENIPLDFLSFKSKGGNPYEHYKIAKNFRESLDNKGLTDVLLFDSEITINEESFKKLWKDDPLLRSAFAGAYFSLIKILYQGIVDIAVFKREYRKDEDLFFTKEGLEKPAIISFNPFKEMALEEAIILKSNFEGKNWSYDDKGVALLAGKSLNKNTLHIVVANAYIDEGIKKITIYIKIKNAPQKPKMKFYEILIDKGTTIFKLDTEYLEVYNGNITIQREIPTPSVLYLKIEL